MNRETIEALLREANLLIEVHPSKDTRHFAKSVVDKITYLLGQLDARSKDAERYRWLREQHWSESYLCVVTKPKFSVKLGNLCPSREHLDEIIDSEMREQ